jgi:hypothetical protein
MPSSVATPVYTRRPRSTSHDLQVGFSLSRGDRGFETRLQTRGLRKLWLTAVTLAVSSTMLAGMEAKLGFMTSLFRGNGVERYGMAREYHMYLNNA